VTLRWDGTRLAQVVFLSLYSELVVPLLPSVIAAAERGDLTLASVIYLRQQGSGLEGLAEGLYLAVECRERAPFSDPVEVDRVADEHPAWMADAVTAEGDLADCDHWTAPPAPDPGEPVAADVPALVLAGRFDPVTPPAWSRGAADLLSASTFVVVPTGGHGVSFDACGADLVAAFLTDPAASVDASCADAGSITWAPG
jgi:pimeloyl-ACP methyl ester carboxylesterase